MALKACKECGNDVSTEAASCPKCGAALKKKGGFWRFIVASFLIFITLIAVVAIIQSVSNPPKPSAPLSATDEKATRQQFQTCQANLEKAKELDMLYDMGARGASIKVLVGPTFFNVPIDTKQQFAATVNCVLMKGSGGGLSFDLLHWQTGKRVASWNGYKLTVD